MGSLLKSLASQQLFFYIKKRLTDHSRYSAISHILSCTDFWAIETQCFVIVCMQDTRDLVCGTWCVVRGTWCVVHSVWYMVCGFFKPLSASIASDFDTIFCAEEMDEQS